MADNKCKDIRVRIAVPDDAEALLAIYAPYVEKTAITFEYEVPSVEEFRGRMQKILQRYPYLVAEMGGRIVGYGYAGAFHVRSAYDWAVEMSVYIAEDKHGFGIGTALYEALEQILVRQNITNLNACIAYPAVEDEYLTRGSVKFHERCGYQLIGHFHQCGYKFGRWYDMVWMEKIIGEHREKQPAVIAWSQLNDIEI